MRFELRGCFARLTARFYDVSGCNKREGYGQKRTRGGCGISLYMGGGVYAGSSLLASECFVGLLRTFSLFFRIFTSFGAKRETIVRINVMKGGL